MATNIETNLHAQLLDRREKLMAIISQSQNNEELRQLLQEVDAALGRMTSGSYGVCEVCSDPIEAERLMVDPLVRYCLPDLTPHQQRLLEQDLDLTSQMQWALLPQRNFRHNGWEAHYLYEPLGPVGGDYCDIVVPENGDGDLFFLLGDVSGKGIASSMMMAHLHAIFRSLITIGLSVNELVERANRIFCESTIPAYYATLVCGRANRSGEIEMCNAGHCPPLLLHRGEVESIAATGLPIGLFYTGQYSVQKIQLNPGDSLFLYTDGLAEGRNTAGAEYGSGRLSNVLGDFHNLTPRLLNGKCMDDFEAFLSGAPKTDDLTILSFRRV
jgi:sigma-B regulation protein RsbU (phosphoserine phosphatase)